MSFDSVLFIHLDLLFVYICECACVMYECICLLDHQEEAALTRKRDLFPCICLRLIYRFIGINNTVLVLSSYYFRNVASRLTTTGNNEISKRSSEFNCYNQKHICYHPNVCVYNFTKLMVEKCEKQHFRLLIISLVDIYMD